MEREFPRAKSSGTSKNKDTVGVTTVLLYPSARTDHLFSITYRAWNSDRPRLVAPVSHLDRLGKGTTFIGDVESTFERIKAESAGIHFPNLRLLDNCLEETQEIITT